MGFHKEGDCTTCTGIGYVVEDDDKEAMYAEADRMVDTNGFVSYAMAIKKLYDSKRYHFHTCPDCGGTGICKAE